MTGERPDGTSETGPEEAFALLGNETRADILRVLGEEPWSGLSFSELRSRVGGDVDSGRFNYHLQQLVGRFVTREEDGYRMRPEGVTLYRAIRAGTYTRSTSVEPFEAGIDCYFCGAAVEAWYEDGTFTVQCPDCSHVYTHTMMPPSTVEGEERAALLDRVDQYNRHRALAVSRGVCPICVNAPETTLVPAEETWFEGGEDLETFVRHECDHCGLSHHMSVGLALVYHPALVSFFHERGLDVTSVRYWELEFATTDRYVTVRATDPWEVLLRVPRDGDALELVVDGDLAVSAERVVEGAAE
ncbi:MAG: winged helix-turn-helix domain-containing protein [Haloarculaceae archaeon]